MQPGKLSHLQINVQPENLGFYRDLFTLLGWRTIYDAPDMLAMGDPNKVSLWFLPVARPVPYDYDGAGVNHLGVGVEAQADVDATAGFLTQRGIPHLFETPRHRPDFSESETHTYYQVMFESPDGILWEIVYTGPKSA
jgi:catechol 2,3-dioxygenase-like lactoylglutathione lyase family enzyme